jgi:cytochrome c peroxidase
VPTLTQGGERIAAVESLGKRLFFDKKLSADGTISCASCHVPEKAFSDGLPVARGVGGQSGTRNTPSLWNVAFVTSQFWDGRRLSLEQQAADPLLNPREHGLSDERMLLTILQQNESYQQDFHRAFGADPKGITLQRVVTAIASFERTLVAADSPFDRYLYGHDPSALPAAAVRGLDLFKGRAHCTSCHVIGERFALLTDNLYHTLGVGLRSREIHLAESATRLVTLPGGSLDRLIGADPDVAALGRFVITKLPRDIGKFKTPALRNVAITAPYMHDGSVATLREAIEVEIYYRGLESNAPLILTPQEKLDILAFLDTLTSPTAAGLVPGS